MIIIIFAALLFIIGIVMIISSLEVKKTNFNKEYKYSNIDNFVDKEQIVIDPVENNSNYDIPDVKIDFDDAEELEFLDDDFLNNDESLDNDSDYEKILEDEVDNYNISENSDFENNDYLDVTDDVCEEAVMFIDNDMIFGDENTDLYLKKDITKLKRIGKGELQLLSNAFYFKSDKKQYRLDFYNIEKIFGEKNYIVIKNLEKDFQLFFMSENNEEFYKKINLKYNKLKK